MTPWPLTPSEVAAFATGGLAAEEIEDFRDGERHRCRAVFHRPDPRPSVHLLSSRHRLKGKGE
ncbi:hypothetical protein [Nonomuraea sp. LPB2021202275-12-8]|uniref:hypothetical protein n=1 Tax=Nonomuraea sp. LPB2021202275-12-8 TaxID=3120159 RepID=UPI00300C3B8A